MNDPIEKRKVMEPGNDGPDATITYEAAGQHLHVYHERSDEIAGHVELTPAGARTTGTFDDDAVMTWMISPAVTGGKYKEEYRLTTEIHDDAVHLIKRKEKSDAWRRREGRAGSHGWREVKRWVISLDGIEVISDD